MYWPVYRSIHRLNGCWSLIFLAAFNGDGGGVHDSVRFFFHFSFFYALPPPHSSTLAFIWFIECYFSFMAGSPSQFKKVTKIFFLFCPIQSNPNTPTIADVTMLPFSIVSSSKFVCLIIFFSLLPVYFFLQQTTTNK